MKTRNERIRDVVTMLAEAWRQKISTATILAYAAGTDDLTIEDIEQGAMRAIRECQFMPSVFELRKLAGASGGITAEDKPTLAWEAVRRAIQRVGSYDSPDFDDKLINAVIRSMGGWVNLCDTPEAEMVWREKVFRTNYLSLSKCELPDEQTCRLAGIAEKENGSAVPVRVAHVGCLSSGSSGVAQIVEQPAVKRIPGPNVVAAETLSQRLGIEDDEHTKSKAREYDPPVPKDVQLSGLRLLGWKGSES